MCLGFGCVKTAYLRLGDEMDKLHRRVNDAFWAGEADKHNFPNLPECKTCYFCIRGAIHRDHVMDDAKDAQMRRMAKWIVRKTCFEYCPVENFIDNCIKNTDDECIDKIIKYFSKDSS